MLKSRIDALAIAFLFCVTLIVTHPTGDFPLNDDWSYGRTVKHIMEQGEFRPTEWQSMPLLTHVLWGALFSMPAGFSFSALRLSTLTLSLGGILATYFLMRELCPSRWLAVLAALTLAFSPIYYALSHTFMSDVPYAAITAMSLFFLVRNLRTDSDCALLLGAMLATAATLSRQLGVSVPLAFAVVLILKNGATKRNLARAVFPPVLCIGALLVFQYWLSATGRMPALYAAQNHSFFHALANPRTVLVFIENAYLASLYLGLFLLPVLIFVFGTIRESHRKQMGRLFTFSAIATMIGAVAMVVFHDKLAARAFSADEITDLSQIVHRLKGQSDGVSAFLWRRLSHSDQAMLMNYQPSDLTSNQVQDVVVRVLNNVLTEKCIYERDRFQDITLPAGTIDLMRQKPAGSKLAGLNRLLLEEAYPGELLMRPNNFLCMPNVGNVLVKSGIGPLTLRDAYELQLNILALPASLWVAVTAASVMGAALLLTALGLSAIHLAPKCRTAAMDGQDAAGAFLLLGAMIYLFPLLVNGFFDRYLITAMPFLSAGLASVLLAVPRTTTKTCRFTAMALLCAFAYYAVCGTRDYLAWNRLRWVALHDLMENKHVKPEDIDGGFEFNGWYMYDPRYKCDPKKSLWWVRGDTYQMGFGSRPGYTVIKEYSYFQWLSLHRGTIVELIKNVPGTPNPP